MLKSQSIPTQEIQFGTVFGIKHPATLPELLGDFHKEKYVVLNQGGGPIMPYHLPSGVPVSPEKAISHLTDELAYDCIIHHFEVAQAKGADGNNAGMDYLGIGAIGDGGSGKMDENLGYILLMKSDDFDRVNK